MSGLVPDQRLVPYDESQQQAIQAFQNLQVHQAQALQAAQAQAQALQAQDQADLSSFGPRVEVSSNNTEFKTQDVEITFDTHCWIRTTTHELFCVTAGTDLKNNKTPFAKLSAMLSPFRPDWMVLRCGASQHDTHILHYVENINVLYRRSNKTIIPCYVVLKGKSKTPIAFFSALQHTDGMTEFTAKQCKSFFDRVIAKELTRLLTASRESNANQSVSSHSTG